VLSSEPDSDNVTLVLKLRVVMAMSVDDFVLNYQDAFVASVVTWLLGAATEANVSITCMCDTSCAANGGISPTGDACGSEDSERRRRQLLQGNAVVEIQFEVYLGTTDQYTSVVGLVNSSSTADFQDALIDNGFDESVARSADVSLESSVSSDEEGENVDIPHDEGTNYMEIAIAVALPISLLMCALVVRTWAFTESAERRAEREKCEEDAKEIVSKMGVRENDSFEEVLLKVGLFVHPDVDECVRQARLSMRGTKSEVEKYVLQEKLDLVKRAILQENVIVHV